MTDTPFQVGDRVQLTSDPDRKGEVTEVGKYRTRCSAVIRFDDGERRAYFGEQVVLCIDDAVG